MPRSKHRRKPGGKSVRHPGRKLWRPPAETPSEAAWKRFKEAYLAPFHREHADEPSGYLLDLAVDAMFDWDLTSFGVAEKDKLFAEFLEPFEDEDEKTLEEAEAALSFLVEREMVVVDGNAVSIHPRFAGVLSSPAAQTDAREGPVSVG